MDNAQTGLIPPEKPACKEFYHIDALVIRARSLLVLFVQHRQMRYLKPSTESPGKRRWTRFSLTGSLLS